MNQNNYVDIVCVNDFTATAYELNGLPCDFVYEAFVKNIVKVIFVMSPKQFTIRLNFYGLQKIFDICYIRIAFTISKLRYNLIVLDPQLAGSASQVPHMDRKT